MPTVNNVHVDALLSNVSVAFQQSASNFVASRVFPIVPVMKQSDRYVVVPKGDFNRNQMQLRADGTQSAGTNFTFSTDSYMADVFALHNDVGPQTIANADSQFGLEQNIIAQLTTQALIYKETTFAAEFMTTSVWSDDRTGVAAAPTGQQFLQWNDTGSDPIKDIRSAATRQQLLTGYRPNVLVLGRQVLDQLELHPDIIDRVKYGTQSNVAIADLSHLARLFQVDEVLVMDSIVNNAASGLADSNAFIGGKTALLVYRPASAGMMSPAAGYTFAWEGLPGSAGFGTTISREEIPLTGGALRYEIQLAFDYKKVSADMGTFFASAVA